MAEKNYVINVKTKAGTIFTVRADSAAELNAQVQDVINNATNEFVIALEDLLTGSTTPVPAPVQNITVTGNTVVPTPITTNTPVVTAANLPNAVTLVQQQLGGEVQQETPLCKHGQRVYMNPANKPWSGWFCADKNAPDKCNPLWDPKG